MNEENVKERQQERGLETMVSGYFFHETVSWAADVFGFANAELFYCVCSFRTALLIEVATKYIERYPSHAPSSAWL